MIKITVDNENVHLHVEGYRKDTAAESVLAVAALVKTFANTLGVPVSLALPVMMSKATGAMKEMEKVENG